MSDNPLKYSDLFDFSDNGDIKAAIRDLKKLKDSYKEFVDSVTGGQMKALADQQKALADSVRELSAASKDLSITQKSSQATLLENAAAMAKLDAQNKNLTATRRAAKQIEEGLAGSVNQLSASLRAQVAQYNALGNTEQRDIVMKRQLVQSINTTRTQIANLNGAVRQNITAFNAAQGSYNALDAQTKKLIIDLKNLPNAFTTNAAAAKKMQATINANIAKLKDFDKSMNITTRNVGNYSDAFSQISGSISSMIGPIALFTGSLAAVNNIIASNAEISDSLSDVRRTAQLTEAEAGKLLKTLKGIDTRTSLKGLLDIAIIAGQLGIAKKDIAGFTESIDQLAIVLSGEIPGGAEEVATALGKINGVFKTQAKEGTTINEAYNKTGSAILALGQVGLATGGYLQDFALRTAGVAQTAKISLPTILAYSAVLEESGSSAEVAGTAFNRLVGSLASKREKFFAIAKLADAKLTLKEFSDVINTDANKALQMFFKGLNQGKNLTQFTDLLGEIKIKAGPAQNAIIALAQQQDKLNERISQSKKAYDDGTLSIDQFEIKNNNLAGSIDKLTNSLTNISTDPDSGIGKMFKYIIDAATDAVKALDKLLSKVNMVGTALKIAFTQGPTALKEADKALKAENSRASTIEANRDARIGSGVSTAQAVLAKNTDQASLDKALKSEEAKLKVLYAQLNYAKAFALNTKNSGEAVDAQIVKYKRLQGPLLQQQTTVDKLRESYKGLYAVQKAGDADAFKDKSKEDRAAKAEAARLAAAEKKARDSASRMLDLSAKSQVADLELKYASGKQDTEDQIALEDGKFKILSEAYDGRLKLYEKDSEDYQRLEFEKVDATRKNEEAKVAIVKAATAKAKQDQEKLDKSISGVGDAQKSSDTSTKENDLSKRLATRAIDEDQYNKELYALRSASIQDEIDQAQAKMDKFGELDSEYFDAKKEKINAEKALAKDKADYEIALAEQSAEKRKQTEQAVSDFALELGSALFSIGSDQSAAKLEDLENQKNAEIALAGNNADAKAKIEEKYNKKILAEKRKQAVRDKVESLFNIAINTAVAVTKALAQTGILSPFVIPGIIAAGALQAATVLAKPLPKYKGGRKGGKGEFAVVNDGTGPELLRKGKDYRIAGAGKETVTWLQPGEEVITAENSVKKIYSEFENSNASNKFIDNLIFGQGIMRAKEEGSQRAIVGAIVHSKLTKSELIDAFRTGLNELEIQQLIIDEKGHNTYLKKKNLRIHDQNARNTFGGQG